MEPGLETSKTRPVPPPSAAPLVVATSLPLKFPRNSGRSKKSVNYSEEKQHEQKAIEFETQTYPAVIYQ